MNIFEIIGTAFTNAFRSKLRTTLTVLAIFVGAFTLTLTNGVGTGVTRYIDTQVASLGASDLMLVTQASLHEAGGMGAPDSEPVKYDPDKTMLPTGGGGNSQFDALTNADIRKIAAINGVQEVDPLRMAAPDYITGPNGEMYELSINPSPSGAGIDLVAGESISRHEERSLVLIPNSYVTALGFASAADAVGKTVEFGVTDVMGNKHTVEGEIAGVQEQTIMAFGMIVSRGLTDELYAAQTTGLPPIVSMVYPLAMVELPADARSDDIARIKAELTELGYHGSTIADQLGVINTVINGIVGVLNAFAAIALIAAGFGIINTLLMSVQERTREIGLMKAMGLSGNKVFALFSTEAVVIGFVGSAIGSVAAIILGTIVSDRLATGALRDLPGLRVLAFDPLSVATVILVVMLIALLSGTLPATRAARLNPIDALRYE